MQGFFRNPISPLARDAARAGLSHRAAWTGAALGGVAVAALLALLTLPACNECDSSIDPVKCTDLCEQDPPHRDCAQCTGTSKDGKCPQCQGPNKAPGCLNADGGTGGSGGNGGMGGSGGVGGNFGTGGSAGVVSGNGGLGGGQGGDAGMMPNPPSCEGSEECVDPREPLCGSEDECVGCEDNDVCASNHAPRMLCDVSEGACVQCLNNESCSNATPFCIDGLCKECMDHDDCDDPSFPRCNGNRECVACDEAACLGRTPRVRCDVRPPAETDTTGQCVQCLFDSNCDNPTPQCDRATGTCVACTGDVACSGRDDDGTPIEKCNLRDDLDTAGQCVQCTGDSATDPVSDVCGTTAPNDLVCDQNIGRCTSARVGSADICDECVADSQCEDNTKCVALVLDGNDFGNYCLYDRATQANACGDTSSAVRPYNRSVPSTSIDGHDATYCLPSTSCEGIRDATSGIGVTGKTCTSSTQCGMGSAGLDGAKCVNLGGLEDHCSYTCDSNSDCPNGAYDSCPAGADRYCQP